MVAWVLLQPEKDITCKVFVLQHGQLHKVLLVWDLLSFASINTCIYICMYICIIFLLDWFFYFLYNWIITSPAKLLQLDDNYQQVFSYNPIILSSSISLWCIISFGLNEICKICACSMCMYVCMHIYALMMYSTS